MPEALQNLIPYAVGGMLLLALILFLAALRLFRLGRRDPYWRRRRAASLQGWQLFLISLTLAFVASAVCLFTGFAQLVFEGIPFLNAPTLTATDVVLVPTATPLVITATPELSPTATSPEASEAASPRVASETPQPTAAATNTATPSPTPAMTDTVTASPTPATATPTATPTRARPTLRTNTPTDAAMPTDSPTPTASPTAALPLTPVQSSVTPRPGASLEITALDDAITNTFSPVNPRATFAAGVSRIYFWVAYQGMTDGAAWTRLLVRDDVPIQGGSYLWGGGEAGTTTYFFGDSEGFGPGAYEVRLYLGETLIAAAAFTVE